MREAEGDGIVELQEEFARIEAAVDAGRTDLSRLGFWRLVREVKVEPALSHHWAEQVGRIDRKAFERSVPLRVPLWVGNVVLGAGVLVSAALGPTALALAVSGRGALAGLALLASAVGLSAAVHSPTHLLVGRLLGIRFTHYFLPTRRFPPFPGVKIDYASYLRAPPGRRALMHASGALATKAAPFALLAALGPLEGYRALPRWSLWAVTLYGVALIVTDVLFSTKRSDWKKVRRERRLARAQIDRRR
ncbi:MAG TPA: hypothetical protein VNO79_13755 [Actinomycetota bacterium]|nr:hypothetical protein [Actinomycetota bacterium]